ncbi:MAG: hypothetical protein WD342_02185 [Verrucomicrobiales bacterium]
MKPKQLVSFTNGNQEEFSISLYFPAVPREADHWGYRYEVRGPNSTCNTFRGIILKTLIEDQESADTFAETGPLYENLKVLLESSKEGWTPITFPDLSREYCVL